MASVSAFVWTERSQSENSGDHSSSRYAARSLRPPACAGREAGRWRKQSSAPQFRQSFARVRQRENKRRLWSARFPPRPTGFAVQPDNQRVGGQLRVQQNRLRRAKLQIEIVPENGGVASPRRRRTRHNAGMWMALHNLKIGPGAPDRRARWRAGTDRRQRPAGCSPPESVFLRCIRPAA